MRVIEGKYTSAKIFTDLFEEKAAIDTQILCDTPFMEGLKVRLMPDVHPGKGCTIGTTIQITDKVVPNMVGVDVSCGMHVVELDQSNIDLQRLDKCIRNNVPVGSAVHSKLHRWAEHVDLNQLRCAKHVDLRKALSSVGSLGSGNHFIELDVDESDYQYLVIHTGSRNPGKAVAEYYQQAAYDDLKSKGIDIPFELAYCEGQLFEDYIHDMKLLKEYAKLNRYAIADIIQCGMRWRVLDEWETLHNYIDTDNMILRKGAISAQKDEIAIIPMNMRDGSLIVKGKGNPDWNYSAPHGAGRLMSRTEAKNSIAMKDYKESMEGVYSTCISAATVDESPQAYKPMQSIIDNISDTCEIVKVIKPVYNFKAN